MMGELYAETAPHRSGVVQQKKQLKHGTGEWIKLKDNTCSTCDLWYYDRWTEEKYGMGVGVCGADDTPAFCDKSDCPFHSNEVD